MITEDRYRQSLQFWIKMEAKRAYMTNKEVNQLGFLQKRVYRVLRDHHASFNGLTDQEIKKVLHDVDPNKVRPRRNELVKLHLVYCSGKRRCTVTNRISKTWRVV